MLLQVFRLLRSLRPLRVINRAPGLKLVVQTLLSSLRPIGNIVLICCTFFIIFGILGVQVKLSYILIIYSRNSYFFFLLSLLLPESTFNSSLKYVNITVSTKHIFFSSIFLLKVLLTNILLLSLLFSVSRTSWHLIWLI